MRTLKFASLLVLGALALTITSQAAPLTPRQAKEKAVAFMTQKKGNAAVRTMERASWRSSSTSLNAGNDLVYAFNAQGGGYVIVAGDDRVDDVLAYSLNGTVDAATIPAAMQTLLASYAEQIEYMQQHDSSPHKALTHDPVPPLMQTKWGQEWPYSYYTPNNWPTGCIATSMSQVMYYHKWPQDSTNVFVTPKNETIPKTHFDWDNMQLTYDSNGQYPESQVTSVARLMQVAGASVDMKYNADQSGSYSRLIRPALLGCFKYDKGMRYLFRDDFTIDQWDDMMYNELANNRPIIFNAQTSWGSGHSFVCHGYDGNGKYYINWGWEGDCDGYFVLSILDSEGTGTGGGGANNRWSVHQDAIIGIQPPVEGSTDQTPGFVQISHQILCSEPNISRDADGNYPLIHVQTIYFGVYVSTGMTYALVDENNEFVHQFSVRDGSQINTIAEDYNCFDAKLVVPNNIADGSYRLVTYYGAPNDPNYIYPSMSNQNIYIKFDVNNGNIAMQPVPVKDLQLTNPQNTLNEDGKITRITFNVKNIADEFNGNLYVVAKNELKGTECVAIRAAEEQQVEFRLKRPLMPDQSYTVYTDPMLTHAVYGDPTVLQGRFEDYDVSLTNIDMENMKVGAHAILGNIKAVNVGNATFNDMMALKAVNPDNEAEVYERFVTPKALYAPVGSEVTMEVRAFLPTNVKRVRIMMAYNDRLKNPVYKTIGDFDVADGAVAISADGKVETLPVSDKLVMPEGYDALYAIGSNVTEVTPNSNPNTIYYVDNPESIQGLDNNNVLNKDGYSSKDVNIYDDYNFLLLNTKFVVEKNHSIYYYRSFAQDEANTWANLWIPLDDYVKVTDLTTGKDWTYLLFPYTMIGLQHPNTIVLQRETKIPESIPNSWELGYFYFIYPSMAGHDFKFELKGYITEFMPWTEFKMTGWLLMTGRSWEQELKDIYVMEGNKFVRKQQATVPAFRSYLIPSADLLKSENTIYDLEAEYILALPTEPDPGSFSAIDQVTVTTGPVDPAWYTIDGRRLPTEPSAPGLYIHNGKKVIKR